MKVRELLSGPEKWCKGASARDSHGFKTWSTGEYATCWCLVGAILRCYPEGSTEVTLRIFERIGEYLPDWNDAPERTFEDVRKLAIELDI